MFFTNTKFNGMNSLRRSTELPEGTCADSLNSDLGSSSVAAPEKGYSLFGYNANATDNIVRQFTFIKQDGTSVLMHVRDNGTNFIVEVLNIEDVRNSSFGNWNILEASLSRSYVIADGTTKVTKFDFSSFNDTGTNQVIYGNGIEVLRIWNGAYGVLSSTTVNTIVLSGTATLAQRGFSATGSVVINGTSFVYTGLSSQTFTGVTTDPTAQANGSGVMQAVDSTTLNAVDPSSILLTANGRLYSSGVHATPNQVNFSAVGDVTSYAGSNPDNGGLEDFPQMNGDITGLANLDEWIIVGSPNKITAFKFEYPSSTTRTVIRKDIADEGFANNKAVKKIGSRIVYITPSGGIKQLTSVSNKDVFTVENLTEQVRPTIEGFDWSDSVLEYLPKKNLLIAFGRSSSDATANDKCVALYFSINEEGQFSYNIDIKDWFVGDTSIYNGDMYFGGSLDSNTYKAFDGYSKNGGPYNWRRTERVEFFGDPWIKKNVRFFMVRGAIGPGTKLIMQLKYGINGSITSKWMELNASDSDWVVQQALNTLGGFALGTEPLGGTIDEISNLYPFKVKFELPAVFPEDIQLTFTTEGSGQIVQIDTYGYDAYNAEQSIGAKEIKGLGLS